MIFSRFDYIIRNLLSDRIGCPNPENLPVYDNAKKEFYCAFIYPDKNPWYNGNAPGLNPGPVTTETIGVPENGCTGSPRQDVMSGEQKTTDGAFFKVGSIITKPGCTFKGYTVI